ncbi:MAG: L-erythro-3,5-diaminohexanoate dehydrogenase [bacterium]
MSNIINLKKELEYLGVHRSLEPKEIIPQAAYKIDNSLPIKDSEILFEVNSLNIDSASFQQLKNSLNNNKELIKKEILKIVKERGKMHNPITNSGGVFLGKIKEIGKNYKNKNLKIGSKVISLTSLTYTPLYLEDIIDINLNTNSVYVKGYAILFYNSPFAVIDDINIEEEVLMMVLDVAGAPAYAAKYSKIGDTVVILGGGKSGVLSAYQAFLRVKPTGKVFIITKEQSEIEILSKLNIADKIIKSDATNPIQTLREYFNYNNELADLVINCTNVGNTEATSILLAKDNGKVIFFSMATSFTQAALQAEGLSKNIELIIGNGYYPNHDKIAIDCIIQNNKIYQFFKSKLNNEKNK